MDSKIILYIFILIVSILSIVFIFSNTTDNYMPGKVVAIYCAEQGYFGVYVKSENPPFTPKDYFCIMNEGDNYLSKDALYIGTYKNFKEMV